MGKSLLTPIMAICPLSQKIQLVQKNSTNTCIGQLFYMIKTGTAEFVWQLSLATNHIH